jgi:hypothetical protein
MCRKSKICFHENIRKRDKGYYYEQPQITLDTQLYMRYVIGAASIKIIKPLSFIIKFASLTLYYPC